MNWKVGDKFFDTGAPRSGIGTIIEIDEDRLIVVWGNRGIGERDTWDEELVPEEIYNSPLYKALQEDE